MTYIHTHTHTHTHYIHSSHMTSQHTGIYQLGAIAEGTILEEPIRIKRSEM